MFVSFHFPALFEVGKIMSFQTKNQTMPVCNTSLHLNKCVVINQSADSFNKKIKRSQYDVNFTQHYLRVFTVYQQTQKNTCVYVHRDLSL